MPREMIEQLIKEKREGKVKADRDLNSKHFKTVGITSGNQNIPRWASDK